MARYAYLMKVSAESNNNKFFIMTENEGGGTFTATYGREGATKPQTKVYPMSKWETKFNEKLSSKKGYTDVTELRSVKQVITEAKAGVISNDQAVTQLIELLQSFAKGVTAANYKVEAKDVTQAQIDAAQASLDKLTNFLNSSYGKSNWLNIFNEELQKLYIIIPRKMKKVSEHLVLPTATKDQILQLIGDEQTNIDAMASQVTSQAATNDDEDNKQEDKQNKTLLEQLGLRIGVVTDKKILDEVTKLAQNHGHRIKNVYAVTNLQTQQPFDTHVDNANNSKTMLLWHGSRVANWMSIIQQGLKIRPSNAVYTGSMWDDGVYFARESDKSMGYTDSGRWVSNGQNVNSVFMALYEVHVGRQLEKDRHDSSCYKISTVCKTQGYDSVWAKKGVSLMRDEFIIYNSNQSTIKYLVEFRN